MARNQSLCVFRQFALDVAPAEVEAFGPVLHPEQFDQRLHEHLVKAQGFQRVAAREFLVHQHRVDRHLSAQLSEPMAATFCQRCFIDRPRLDCSATVQPHDRLAVALAFEEVRHRGRRQYRTVERKEARRIGEEVETLRHVRVTGRLDAPHVGDRRNV